MRIKKSLFFFSIGSIILFISLLINPIIFGFAFILLIKGLSIYLLYFKFIKEKISSKGIHVFSFIFLFSHFSLFIYHFFSFFNLTLKSIHIFLIELIIPLIIIIILRKDFIKLSKAQSINPPDFFSVAVLILLLLLLCGPFYKNKEMPLTDSLVEVGYSYDFYERIIAKEPQSVWSSRFMHGYPITLFEGLIMPYLGGVNSIIFNTLGIEIFQTIKNLVLFYLLLFSISIYIIFRMTGINRFISISGTLFIFFTDSLTHGIGHGQFRHSIFMIFPVLAFIFLYKLLSPKEEKLEDEYNINCFNDFLGLLLSFIMCFFIHPTMFLVSITMLTIFSLVYLLFTKKKISLFLLENMKIISLSAIIMIISFSFYAVSFIENNNYFAKTASPEDISIKQTVSSILTLGQIFNAYDFTIFFIAIVIIASLLSFLRKNKENLDYLLFSLIISIGIFLSLYLMKPLYFFVKYLDSFFFRVAHSIGFMFYILGAVSLFLIYKRLKKSPIMIKNRIFLIFIKTFLIILISISTLFIGIKINTEIRETTRESALISPFFARDYSFLSNQPDGRVMTFGIYPTTFSPALSFMSGKDIVNHGTWQLQHMSIYQKLRGQGNLYNFNNGPYYIQNIIKSTGIKYIYLFLCSYPKETQEQLIGYSIALGLEPIYQEDCKTIFKDNNSFVELTEVVKDTPLSQKEYYSRQGAYTVQPINKELTETDEVPRNGTISSIPYIRPNDHEIIIIPKTAGFIHVKEQFFPWWHAYGDGIEISVYKAKIGTMVIEDTGFSKIILRYEIPNIVKILFLIGLICIFLSPLILLINEKNMLKAKKSLNMTKRVKKYKK